MCPIKEPTFFGASDLLRDNGFLRRQERDRPALESFLRGPQSAPASLYVSEWSDYLELFRNVRDEIAIGEASGGYLLLPGAAAAIRTRIPDARLIFILRHPVEVAFSWYVLTLAREADLTFAEWFRKEIRAKEYRATDVGLYASHLQRFMDVFPVGQLRIYLYEDFQRDARSLLRDVFSFLGVDPDHPIDTSTRHNQTSVPRFPKLERLGRRWLGPFLPPRAKRALRGLVRRGRESFTLDAESRCMAIDYYRDEITRTAALIRRDLSAWLR